MSSRAFGEIKGNMLTLLDDNKQLRDIKGYSLQMWENYGIVGGSAAFKLFHSP